MASPQCCARAEGLLCAKGRAVASRDARGVEQSREKARGTDAPSEAFGKQPSASRSPRQPEAPTRCPSHHAATAVGTSTARKAHQ